MLQQRRLVLDVVACCPCLDLIAESLELLDFALEVVLQLLFLGDVVGLLNLFVDGLEFGDAFRHLLEALVDFLLEFACRHLVRLCVAEMKMLSLITCLDTDGLGLSVVSGVS